MNLDIDGNGIRDALTDGILMIRYLFGLRGDDLRQNAIGANATRTNAADLVADLDQLRDTLLDVDANGSADALTDGILIIRYLFGIRGDTLSSGAIANDATRTSGEAIASFLESFNSTATAGTLAFSEPSYSVSENGVNATITVTRSGGSDGAVSVNYATQNGSATAVDDYIARSGVLTFADGETSKSFTIAISDDRLVESEETVNLVLSNPTDGATLGTQSRASLSIIDNDESQTSSGFNIAFDYRFDSTGFFDDPAARTALEAAAEIWEGSIQDEFANVPAGIEFAVENPATGGTEMVVLDAEIDDLLIFVGARSLRGNTLGIGGPDGVNAAGSIFSNRIRGSNFEPWVGGMTFDPDANWFFDSTPDTDDDIPFGESDFISTALHEIGHILGIGTADIFAEIGAGAAFDGLNALAVNGGEAIPLESDLSHVQEGFLNNTVLMDPISTSGTRNLPSQVDLAISADIGYEISGFTAQGETPPIATPEDDVTIFGTIIADTIDGKDGNDQIQGDRGDDLLNGGDGDDLLFGQLGNDTLNGDPGSDRLLAGEGDDLLNGGDGDDVLFGELGNDTLNGSAGNDILIGEAGIDTFFFDTNNGEDTINDFEVATEVIQIAASLGFSTGQEVFDAITSQGNVTGGGRFAVVSLSPSNTITIFAEADVTASNFLIV